MHVDRIDSNQRCDSRRVRQNVLGHRPRFDKNIVSREQQNTCEPIEVAEACNPHQFIDVFGRIRIARYGRKYTKLRLRQFRAPWASYTRPGLGTVEDASGTSPRRELKVL